MIYNNYFSYVYIKLDFPTPDNPSVITILIKKLIFNKNTILTSYIN